MVGDNGRSGNTGRGIGDIEDSSGIDCDGCSQILAVDDGADHAPGIGHHHVVGFNLLPLAIHHRERFTAGGGIDGDRGRQLIGVMAGRQPRTNYPAIPTW